MFCHRWEPQCGKSQVCLGILFYVFKQKVCTGVSVAAAARALCPLEGALALLSSCFSVSMSLSQWGWVLQPVHETCLRVLQMSRTSCRFCSRSPWWRLTGPFSHAATQGAAEDTELRPHWSIGSSVLKDWQRLGDISLLSVFGVAEGNGSDEILSLWGYYYNQMLRFPKHAPWFVFALQCECGGRLLWTVFLSAKPGTKYGCAAWRAS